MEIPWQSLSEEALEGILEEYATREGTEYGWQDVSLETKVLQLRKQLERKEARIDFDPDTQSCELVPVR